MCKSFQRTHKRKSVGPWERQRFHTYDIKGMSHQREKLKGRTSLKYRSSALWNTLLRKWKGKPQIGRRYFQNTYVIRDLYPGDRKNSFNSKM